MATQNDLATPHEIRDRELFDRIAETYCRKDLQPASRLARKCRLFQTLKVIQPSEELSYLEVGCGAGFAAEYLHGKFSHFCGVDYSENLISYAKAHQKDPEVDFVTANINDFQPGQQFDVVFAIGLLHHLDDLEVGLGNMMQFLKPGGWLVANEPQPGNPFISLARHIRKRVDQNYSADQRELNKEELRVSFENVGLHNVKVIPQGLFSTPFAEVSMKPQWLFRPISTLACSTDTFLEKIGGQALSRLTWNLVVTGQKPI